MPVIKLTESRLTALKTSFTLTLSLVLLLSLFAAVWAAFYSARRMVAPLQDLAQGTRAVADGDYETQLPESGQDEVGFLVESFNDMTRRLAKARDETRQRTSAVIWKPCCRSFPQVC